jgi:hypothetical protein
VEWLEAGGGAGERPRLSTWPEKRQRQTRSRAEEQSMSVFNRLPTEGYAQGGKFWLRERQDQELEGAMNTRL